jgi:hypothetical protein
MNTLSIHVFPHELENYIRVINQLEESINTKTDIEVKSVLNINKSVIKNHKELEKQIYSFNSVSQMCHGKIKSHITSEYFGVNEHRRVCINDADVNDNLIFLDVDLQFNDELLTNLLSELQSIINEYYVITPQVVRLWDSTWDIIVNENYKKEKIGFCNKLDISSVLETNHGDSKLIMCEKFKWAGGWFTCISAKLAKYIGIPDVFVGYGHDDTFMMHCCGYMKSRKIKVQQFTLLNNVVCEDRTLINKNKKYIKINNFRQLGNRHVIAEYNNFKKRVNRDIYNINES